MKERNNEIKQYVQVVDYLNKSFALKNFLNFYANYDKLPTIYLVTPTYARFTQMADLHRLRNTLINVPKILWMVIEDAPNKTDRVVDFMKNSGVPHVHFNLESPSNLVKPDPTKWYKHRGVVQRNFAMDWLKNNIKNEFEDGVIYFADDAYDLQLFEEVNKDV